MPGPISPSDATIDELVQFYRRGMAQVDERLGQALQRLASTSDDERRKIGAGTIGPWDRTVLNAPEISKPNRFSGNPLIISSDDDFIRDATRLTDAIDPYIKSNIQQIVVGPTKESMRFQSAANKPLGNYDVLYGVYGGNAGRIGISPELNAREKILTLIHELGHVAYPGTGHDDKANEAESIFNKMQPENAGKVERWSPSQIRRK